MSRQHGTVVRLLLLTALLVYRKRASETKRIPNAQFEERALGNNATQRPVLEEIRRLREASSALECRKDTLRQDPAQLSFQPVKDLRNYLLLEKNNKQSLLPMSLKGPRIHLKLSADRIVLSP